MEENKMKTKKRSWVILNINYGSYWYVDDAGSYKEAIEKYVNDGLNDVKEISKTRFNIKAVEIKTEKEIALNVSRVLKTQIVDV
jgi:hypothetical protein